MPVKRIQHLFVVRLWADTAAVPTAEDWHGLVQHVPTGQKLYFTSLADLNDFMEARLEAGASPPERSDEAAEGATVE
jgi:hypothetical protein